MICVEVGHARCGVVVVLCGGNTAHRAGEGAEHVDGGRDLRGAGRGPDLAETGVQRADGGEDDDREPLEPVID